VQASDPLGSQEIHQLSVRVEVTFPYPLEIKTFPTFIHSLGNLWPYLIYCLPVLLRKLTMFTKHYISFVFKAIQWKAEVTVCKIN